MTATAKNTEGHREEITFALGETLTASSTSSVILQLCRKDGFKRHCPSSPETTVIGVCVQEASLPKLSIGLDSAFPTPDSVRARETLHDAQIAICSAARERCSHASGKLRTEDKTWARQIRARQGDWNTNYNERSDVTRPGEGDSRYVIVNFEVSYEPKVSQASVEQDAADNTAAEESLDQDGRQ